MRFLFSIVLSFFLSTAMGSIEDFKRAHAKVFCQESVFCDEYREKIQFLLVSSPGPDAFISSLKKLSTTGVLKSMSYTLVEAKGVEPLLRVA